MIFHITKIEDWKLAKECGEYRSLSLKTEGFIHCSTFEQVIRVADFIFKGQLNLTLLEIDDNTVTANIKYEGETDEKFPHIYGPLNIDAVIKTYEFSPKEDGYLQLPSSVSTLKL